MRSVSGSALQTAEIYSYDAVGNRTGSQAVASYSYDSSNHLTGSADGVAHTYDNKGNTLTRTDANGTTAYHWDALNHLASVDLPNGGGSVAFGYDPFGRRVRKSGPQGTLVYLLDDQNVLAEYDGTGTLQAKYEQNLGVDEPMAATRGSATAFYAQDGLRSVTSLTDGGGNQLAGFSYTAFGATQSTTGTLASSFRYTGRELDPETGLYYRARYYDPQVGRFASEDPQRFNESPNFYQYVFGNPETFIDPTGEHCWYSQSTGTMICKDDNTGETYYSASGNSSYSGSGSYKNDPDSQDLDSQGPIPRGDWQLTGDWFTHPHAGRNAMRLKPLPGNECFKTKRDCSTFMVHGDSSTHTASQGCIIQPPNRTKIRGGEVITVTP